MGFLSHFFYPWGLLLQGLAIVHFIRRRPDTYWIYIILFLGPIGATIYLVAEALPDIGLVGQSFKGFSRRKRIGELEVAVRDNPSSGNYEELGDLYMDDGKFQLARAAFDKAIAARANTPDPFYRRGVCALRLGDAAAALPDLERVTGNDPDYDFHRAAGLLAHAYAQTGQKEKAEALFRQVTMTSTSSETYLNFADLLASEGRNAEAREWAQKVLDKKPTMPGYLRRRERPWFRSASAMLRRLAMTKPPKASSLPST
ncbi:tetratricopeptide repeat protein [Edaphobacter bradus]|uniref:tetratricopeptide repeat protein n=1 Tax=Edaphobacter bradus TaxID=2259016 RepID=UPI0021E08795|nr:tetratricopeptide repeat protein [Edaphobacter bradus]